MRIALWSGVGVGLLLLLGTCAGLLWIRAAAKAALPVLDGEIKLAGAGTDAGGLSAAVTVQRDAHGVPHIRAANEKDLWIAQGYVTAQDRLWQMDLLRRNANGELAEVFGPSQVAHDRAQRVLQFRLTAQRIYRNLSATDRGRLEAYARGVNLFIAQHPDTLPAEFRMLFYRPHPWTGEDSVSIGLTMVQGLDTHFEAKLVRAQIAARLRNPKLEADLYPVGSWRDRPPTGIQQDLSQPHPPTPSTEDDEDEDRTETRVTPDAVPSMVEDPHRLRHMLGLADCDGCSAGSNNWAIAGRHTSSGKPLLSNDMHLTLLVPNIWYMADLQAPGFHATGVTLPGAPAVIAGHNEHVAWGITALYGDVQDLYVENLDGKGNYRAVDGRWKPLAVDHELITVRGGKDVRVDVQLTEHGPLLNPLFANETRPIALKWNLYDPTLNALPVYELDKASNWTEFSAALKQWCWPTQNVVYSDDQGHIAYQAVGRVPLRPGGLQGVPIEDAQHEWQGYIPFEKMPGVFDPPSGFVATANSRVTTPDSDYPLSLDWVEPYRVERIYKQLQGRDQLTPQDMLAVQTDIYSEVDQELGQRFAYAIDHAGNADERMHKAADLMRHWDGRLSTDSAAASLVTRTRGELWPMLLEPKLGRAVAGVYTWYEKNFAEEEIVMRANPGWLPKKYKNWDTFLADAVRKAMKNGKSPSDVARWSYGSWHVVDLEHPLASLLPDWAHFAGTGPQPFSGDNTTVKQVGRDFGPSQRFTMDWSNIDGSTEDIVMGESGNPFSSYFRDQWADWYGGRTFALPFTDAAVSAQTRHTLRLVP